MLIKYNDIPTSKNFPSRRIMNVTFNNNSTEYINCIFLHKSWYGIWCTYINISLVQFEASRKDYYFLEFVNNSTV